MKIEIFNIAKSFNNEPNAGSVIVTKENHIHLVINLEAGFTVCDLEANECFIFDDYEDYLVNHDINEIFTDDEIVITLSKRPGGKSK